MKQMWDKKEIEKIIDEHGGDAVWGSITGTLSNQTDLQNALNAKANSSSLAAVATSGSYNDLSNKPTIPPDAKIADMTSYGDISDAQDFKVEITEADYNTILESNFIKAIDSMVGGVVVAPLLNDYATGYGEVVFGPIEVVIRTDNARETYKVEHWAFDVFEQSGTYILQLWKLFTTYINTTVPPVGTYYNIVSRDQQDNIHMSYEPLPAAQVQSDWNQSDSSAVDYIKNKPTIPNAFVDVASAGAGQQFSFTKADGTRKQITVPGIREASQSDNTLTLTGYNYQGYNTSYTYTPTYANLADKPALYDVIDLSSYSDGDTLSTADWDKVNANRAYPIKVGIYNAFYYLGTIDDSSLQQHFITWQQEQLASNGTLINRQVTIDLNTHVLRIYERSKAIPDAVSGTNDGTNWTSLTIGSVTKAIPSGGGSGGGLQIIYINEPMSVTNGTLSAADLAKIVANPSGCVIIKWGASAQTPQVYELTEIQYTDTTQTAINKYLYELVQCTSLTSVRGRKIEVTASTGDWVFTNTTVQLPTISTYYNRKWYIVNSSTASVEFKVKTQSVDTSNTAVQYAVGGSNQFITKLATACGINVSTTEPTIPPERYLVATGYYKDTANSIDKKVVGIAAWTKSGTASPRTRNIYLLLDDFSVVKIETEVDMSNPPIDTTDSKSVVN